VLMNAAAALVAAGRADSLADAMPMAIQSIDTGAARAKLSALVEFTNRHHL
jgi:anthranilate phosphoribosyltransferase